MSTRLGLVIGLQSRHNKTSSEIATVQTLLEHLQWQGVGFSLDALHVKKTVQPIIASRNHYWIAIKANQPKLLAQVQPQFEHSSPLSCHVDSERTRDRCTQRRVCVLEPIATIDPS
jgi:predicted transposase YbfD/YdcC